MLEKNSGGSTIFKATFTYDVLDRRIETQVDSDGSGPNEPVMTWTVHDGSNLYGDFGGSGNLQNRYFSGDTVDELVARTSASGGMTWCLDDRMGNGPTNFIDPSGMHGAVVSNPTTGSSCPNAPFWV